MVASHLTGGQRDKTQLHIIIVTVDS